jgi:Uma2 family endonuclease
MSRPQARIYFTEEEYLAIERDSEEKHEYLDGRIFAMAGETESHNTICVNIASELRAQLKGGPCRTFSKDMKVRSGPEPKSSRSRRGLYSYPDVLVACGERLFHDYYRDVLLNPTVIIEVLSKYTEAFDRGEKFAHYRTWVPSFTDYILVSQNKPVIEYYRRQPNGEWLLATVEGLDASLSIGSIGCTLKLSEVYDGVVFKADWDEPNAGQSDQ